MPSQRITEPRPDCMFARENRGVVMAGLTHIAASREHARLFFHFLPARMREFAPSIDSSGVVASQFTKDGMSFSGASFSSTVLCFRLAAIVANIECLRAAILFGRVFSASLLPCSVLL